MIKDIDITIAEERPDQPDIIELIKQLDDLQIGLYPPESNHLLDIRTLCDPNVFFLAARKDGHAVGCGAIKFDPRGWAEIKRMYVAQAMRGKGLGQKILSELEKNSYGRKIFCVFLETGIHSHEALAAYRRAGYRERAAFGDYAPDPLSVFMEKDIEQPVQKGMK